MKRINNIANEAIRFVTLPIRVSIGLFNAIYEHTPDTLEVPFEIKRKENDNGNKEKPQS